MTEPGPLVELTPLPDTVVELVRKLVEKPLPRCAEERENLFARLGFKFVDRSKRENGDSPHQIAELDVSFGGRSQGSWDTYNGQFLGITVHLYNFQESGDPATQRGFSELRIQLTELFGKPEHPWDDIEMPPCIWYSNGWTITTHLFDGRDSSVMLSVEDTALAAVAEGDVISL